MSNQSGITASEEVVEASNFMQDPVLVIALSEDSTVLVKDANFKQPPDPDHAISALHEYFGQIFPEPRYAILQNHELFFVSFIPDLAPIRQKMLYASTKNTILQQLGSKFSKLHVLDFTETKEICPSSFVVEKPDFLAVMTEKEKSLQHLDTLQNLTLSQSSAHTKELPSMSADSSLFFQVEPLLEKVLHEPIEKRVVVMNINVEAETLALASHHENVLISELAQTLGSQPESAPVYILYGYGVDLAVFIYSCPSGCKVKARIMYAANKQGLLNHLKGEYKQPITKVIEVGDLDEIDVSVLQPSRDVEKHNALKFNKPKGPRRR